MRLRLALLAPLALLTVAPGSTIATEPAPCLPFEPETITVTGRLTRETYPGPPNYESVDSGDTAEDGFYLTPAVPLCFGAVPTDELNASDSGVGHLQLVLDSLGYERFRPHLGRTVAARGTALSAHTGHHHAPVLIQVLGGPLDPATGAVRTPRPN